MPGRKPHSRELILDLIRNDEWGKASEALQGLHPADIADIIDHAPQEDHNRLFAMINADVQPDVLSELEAVAGNDVLKSLTNKEVSDLIEDMAPDDAADILSELLTEERSKKVLDLMEDDESEEVKKLLKYEEDTAGGIMTSEIITMLKTQTVEEAIQAIAYIETHEQFYNANIVDDKGILIGYVNIWELLKERNKKQLLGDIAHKDFEYVTVDTDQEEVARIMNQYDLTVIPVVDHAGTLVGRITADDVIDVMEEEASEDIFHFAGSDDAELETTSAWRSCLYRLPWLLITLFGGFITSSILKQYVGYISHVIALTFFVPIVLAMGGNAGIQSSTLIVRQIAIGDLRGRKIRRIITREIIIGITMGVICAVIIGLWAMFITHCFNISLIVATALVAALTFATMFGGIVPIVLEKISIDPAVAAGPFVTIANDIGALLIYYGVTILMMSRLY